MRRLSYAAGFCLLFSNFIFGQNAPPEPLSQPAKQIDLSNLGFHGLPPLERFTLRGNVTVHFLNREHVLVTFDARKLMKRVPETATGHQDRMIRAEVVDIASGSISKQTEWYVHDKRRYLWALTTGKLLLRKLNSLYEIDSELNEKLLITFPSELLWVDTTPDGKHIIVETALLVPQASKNEATGKTTITAKRPRVKIDYLDAATLTVERSLMASGSLELNTSNAGYRLCAEFSWRCLACAFRDGSRAKASYRKSEVTLHTGPAVCDREHGLHRALLEQQHSL